MSISVSVNTTSVPFFHASIVYTKYLILCLQIFHISSYSISLLLQYLFSFNLFFFNIYLYCSLCKDLICSMAIIATTVNWHQIFLSVHLKGFTNPKALQTPSLLVCFLLLLIWKYFIYLMNDLISYLALVEDFVKSQLEEDFLKLAHFFISLPKVPFAEINSFCWQIFLSLSTFLSSFSLLLFFYIHIFFQFKKIFSEGID